MTTGTFKSFAEAAVRKTFAFSKKDYFAEDAFETTKLLKDLQKSTSKKKNALKCILANMVRGINVSEFFTKVLQCMQTPDIELKRLVYLYLVCNSPANQTSAILCINSFAKDLQERNPLLRALSLRTLGSLGKNDLLNPAVELVRQSYQDPSPYVRKTVSLTIGKLLKDLTDESIRFELLELLESLCLDTSPGVASNAFIILAKALEAKARFFTDTQLDHLFSLFDSFSEWGQLNILRVLTENISRLSTDHKRILSTAAFPKLAHTNPAVVLAATKAICLCETAAEMDYSAVSKSIATNIQLASAEEKYILLCNLPLLVQAGVTLEVSCFFCKTTEPNYIKKKRLELAGLFCTEEDWSYLSVDFSEYMRSADLGFASATISSLSIIAQRLPQTAEDAIQLLAILLPTAIPQILEQIISCLATINRTHPTSSITSDSFPLGSLTDPALLHQLHAPKAREDFFWVLGEVRMPQPKEAVFRAIQKDFSGENLGVQQAILTAAAKCLVTNEIKEGLFKTFLEAALKNTGINLYETAWMYKKMVGNKELFFSCLFVPKKAIFEECEVKEPAQIGLASAVIKIPKKTKKILLKKKNATLNDLIDLKIEETAEAEVEHDIFSLLCR